MTAELTALLERDAGWDDAYFDTMRRILALHPTAVTSLRGYIGVAEDRRVLLDLLTAAYEALRREHRYVVADTSGNMAGHVAIRDGWLEPADPDTGWSEVTPEPCDTCELLADLAPLGERKKGD